MRFKTMTRYDGQIHLEMVDGDPGLSYGVSAVAKDGTALPGALVWDGCRAVLVLADLTVAQRVTVEAMDGQGKVQDKKVLHVDPLASKVKAKLHRLSRGVDAASLEGVDSRPVLGEATVEVLGLHDDLEGTDIVRGEVAFLIPAGQPVDGAVSVRVLDREGTVLADSWIQTGNRVRILADGSQERTVGFSTRVSHELDWFCVDATMDQEGVAPGFSVVTPPAADLMRRQDDFQRWRSPLSDQYDGWFRAHRTSERDLAIQRRQRFSTEPVFSIIVPLFKTPLDFFHEMVDSVVAQTYPRWELVLVNASPEEAELAAAVEERRRSDGRIKVVTLDGNRGITLNTNAGIEAATGEFLSFFDHDDLLEPDLLYRYMEGLEAFPDTDLFYCDEDKVMDGVYRDGYFKPDFSWDLLCTNNYICHLLTVRKALVDAMDELPGARYDGSQDHNLTMVVAEKARNIYHARRVLYHWRVHRGSTAAGADSKPWTQESGRIAIQEHLDRVGLDAKVADSPLPNVYELDYAIPEGTHVSIIIPNKDARDLLGRCVDSIVEKTTFTDYSVVVVENNSEDPETFRFYGELEAAHPNLSVVRYDEKGFNFSALCNLGAEASHGATHLLFLNNDTEVIEGRWLELLLGPLQRPEVWASGAKLLYPDGLIQHVGINIPQAGPFHLFLAYPGESHGYFGFPTVATRNLQAVTGACLMVDAQAFERLGGFDEKLPVAFNDVEFCQRLVDAGGQIVIEPRARLYHHESVSRGNDLDDPAKHSAMIGAFGYYERLWPRCRALGDRWYSALAAPLTDQYQMD